jgi:hemolysin activation/secretion protein
MTSQRIPSPSPSPVLPLALAVRLACLTALAVLNAAPAAAQTTVPAAVQGAAASDLLLDVKRFEIVGANPLSEAESAAVLAPHLGPHRNLGTLEAAATALEARMRERGFSFHRVIIPAQKPAAGVVKLEILQFPLASVDVVGNQHFSADNIRRSLPGLAPGTSPDVREISSELGLVGEHPSKRVSIVLKESTKADALDAEIRVRDVAPEQFFTSFTANTRDAYNATNESTGYTRLTFGYQNANLFDRDHVLTVSYTTSPEHPERVSQYGAFYWIPLYGYATSLQLYYTRSDVSTGSIGLGASSFNVSGKGEFMGARLTHSLPKYGDITHNVSLAIDDRFFENDVGVADITLPSTSVRSRPLSLRYSARMEQPWGSVGAYAEPVTNLSGGSANTDTAYESARPGAKRRWSAVRYGIDASYALGNWGLSARLRGQHTDSELIPGEQFGLGGVASVRGLREREFAGDQGYTMTLEALGPPLTDGLRPLFFFDAGSARLLGNGSDTVTKDSAASVGAGLRWNWERRLDVSADLAYVLNGIASTDSVPGTKAGDIKLMLTAFYRF